MAIGRQELAVVSVLGRLSVSACALPRPSAIASAKLANRTVSHSQTVICSYEPRLRVQLPDVRSTRPSSAAADPTTNITGFAIIVRG